MIVTMIITDCSIGHDNAGGGGAWFLDRIEIDCPHLGKKWVFPHNRWLAKDEDDGKLERELFPQDMATEEYNPCKSVKRCLTVFQYPPSWNCNYVCNVRLS